MTLVSIFWLFLFVRRTGIGLRLWCAFRHVLISSDVDSLNLKSFFGLVLLIGWLVDDFEHWTWIEMDCMLNEVDGNGWTWVLLPLCNTWNWRLGHRWWLVFCCSRSVFPLWIQILQTRLTTQTDVMPCWVCGTLRNRWQLRHAQYHSSRQNLPYNHSPDSSPTPWKCLGIRRRP
jgi:hypothetical protein